MGKPFLAGVWKDSFIRAGTPERERQTWTSLEMQTRQEPDKQTRTFTAPDFCSLHFQSWDLDKRDRHTTLKLEGEQEREDKDKDTQTFWLCLLSCQAQPIYWLPRYPPSLVLVQAQPIYWLPCYPPSLDLETQIQSETNQKPLDTDKEEGEQEEVRGEEENLEFLLLNTDTE